MSENMKPCPWCGQTDRLEVKARVICTRCGILGPQYGYTQELAIDHWNRRAHDNVDGLVEALEGFVEWCKTFDGKHFWDLEKAACIALKRAKGEQQ